MQVYTFERRTSKLEHVIIQDIRRDLNFGKTEQFSGQHDLACVQNQNIQGKW